MLLPVWQTLVVAGLLASTDAFVRKQEPLYTGTLGFGIWVVIAFGATAIQPVSGGEILAGQREYAVAILAVANALVHLLVGIKAATGSYDDNTGAEGLSSPAGEYAPRDQLRGD